MKNAARRAGSEGGLSWKESPESTIAAAPHLVPYPHGFLRWLEEELLKCGCMRLHFSTPLAVRQDREMNRTWLGGISEGALRRLQPA